MKVAICLPCYDGKVALQWMASYVGTHDLLTDFEIGLELISLCGNGLIPAARNELVTLALSTDCTHVVMVDGKQLWEPVGILRLLRDLDVADFVVAPAPTTRGDFHARFTGETQGFLREASHAAIAFGGCRREVLEGMRERFPGLTYSGKDGVKHVALFDTEVMDGAYVGEDLRFSMRVREAGYRLWVDEAVRVRRLIQ